jgi:hypothetical protein
MFPIVGIIAVFDIGNGRSFKENLSAAYGMDAKK